MKIFQENNLILPEIADDLKSGSIMIYPTDTVAGIGSIGSQKSVIDKIFQIKNREPGKNVSYAFSSIEMLDKYVKINDKAFKLFKFFPGPITLVLPRKPETSLYGIQNTIGCRIPDVPWLLELIHEVGEPIVTTSANLSGSPPITKFDEIDFEAFSSIDIAIRWERSLKNTPSTVVEILNDKLRILREGVIPASEIMSIE